MLVAAFAVLFLRLPRSDHAAAPPLAAPANVTMETMNTDYVLRWDWDQSWGQDVTFTTQYISHSKARNPHRQDQWEELCANLTHHSCDLQGGPPQQGVPVPRRRGRGCPHRGPAERRQHLHEDAAAGPVLPHPVLGRPRAPPVLTGPEPEQQGHPGDPVGPEGRTCYCVAVQTLNRYHPKKSSFTSPICIQTPGALVWWLSVLCFLGSMLGCFLLGFFFYKTSKWLQTVFFPASQLPSHFKEYLCDFPGSDMPRLLTSDAEQRCDKVVVCPRWPPEEHNHLFTSVVMF
ncbi:unnamed protein product [Tetraodon nigroviridis]|uniref:(spotted green pufferfish) hypothetical protein n=1 Tax=Tetraodon nigroviridis TaxID=99883 RepID=Q4T1A8_TETNG|nr:unnamed protein product [Tetraodon nigroviridis]